MEKIIVNVEATWEKSNSVYAVSGYTGGYTIIGYPPGYPQINGGYGSPDFGEYNVEWIRKKIINDWIGWEMLEGKTLIVKIKVTRDDRLGMKQSELESFF